MAGYSGKPLATKLGYKPGMRVHVIDPPRNYDQLLAPLPEGVRQLKRLADDLDLIHLFAATQSALLRQLPRSVASLAANGSLWISWPKRSSGVATDLGEADVRRIGLTTGLVDVKVCAVDETWSGLKFVYRLKDRH